MQIINLPSYCLDSGTIIHELIHGWGFWHEHARPDRDSYVKVYWGNIRPDSVNNFYRQTHSIEHGQYDGNSVMHYPSWQFSKNGYATILPWVCLFLRLFLLY